MVTIVGSEGEELPCSQVGQNPVGRCVRLEDVISSASGSKKVGSHGLFETPRQRVDLAERI